MNDSTLTALDILRAVVLFETVFVTILSVTSAGVYLRRGRRTDKLMRRHVVTMMFVFIALCIDRFIWTFGRFGAQDFNPIMIAYLVIFGAAMYGMYVLYGRQITMLREDQR